MLTWTGNHYRRDRASITKSLLFNKSSFVLAWNFLYYVQGYEDYLRHQADKEVNESDTIIIKDGEEKHVTSKDIKVCKPVWKMHGQIHKNIIGKNKFCLKILPQWSSDYHQAFP